MKYKTNDILGIYHTHSKYSRLNHGKDTVQDMCAEAERLGLKEYAITDHGPKHAFGVSRKKARKLRAELTREAKKRDLKILMGIEFNLLGVNGETDYYSEFDNLLDIRLLGVHKAGFTGIKNFFKFLLPNFFNGESEKVIERNTDAYISAIKKYKIDLVTHPQEYVKVNLKRLGEACAENNCYIEINNKHLRYTKEDITTLLETPVKFIVSSDAHSVDKVLSVDKALQFIEEFNIPEDRVANLNKLPDFKCKY